MTILCKKFFPNELSALQNSLVDGALGSNMGLRCSVTSLEDWEEEEPEEIEDNINLTISG